MENVQQFAIRILSKHVLMSDDAVMFDIDDTLINSNCGKPIKWVVDIFHLCKKLGYITIIITARPDSDENKRYTKNELSKCGIEADLLLFALPENKTTTKNQLKNRIIMSFGDQITDLDGGLYFVKLPDYMNKKYYIGTNISSDSGNLCKSQTSSSAHQHSSFASGSKSSS